MQKQFSHVNHAGDVCSDIASVSDVLSQLQFCFTDNLVECTRLPRFANNDDTRFFYFSQLVFAQSKPYSKLTGFQLRDPIFFLLFRTILLAREKINEIIVSFAKLHYDAFDPANGHHWRDHVSWFKRRVSRCCKDSVFKLIYSRWEMEPPRD